MQVNDGKFTNIKANLNAIHAICFTKFQLNFIDMLCICKFASYTTQNDNTTTFRANSKKEIVSMHWFRCRFK